MQNLGRITSKTKEVQHLKAQVYGLTDLSAKLMKSAKIVGLMHETQITPTLSRAPGNNID